MRLWSIHPKYLDSPGLTGLWRESLLAKKVLEGGTRGYTAHPQLDRFRDHREPLRAISEYLHHVFNEANARGFNFDRSKYSLSRSHTPRIEVTKGQLMYEFDHLKKKLQRRAPGRLAAMGEVIDPETHPLFFVMPGKVMEWERPTTDRKIEI